MLPGSCQDDSRRLCKIVIFAWVDGLGTEAVQVVAEHLNQTLVVSDVCFRTVREKWQSQRIDRQMSFDDERFWDRESAPKLSPVCAFVMTKSLRVRHWHCTYSSQQVKSMINNRVQFGFFGHVAAPVHVTHS